MGDFELKDSRQIERHLWSILTNIFPKKKRVLCPGTNQCMLLTFEYYTLFVLCYTFHTHDKMSHRHFLCYYGLHGIQCL